MHHQKVVLIIILALLVAPCETAIAQQGPTVIFAGSILDVDDGTLRRNVAIKIREGVIQEVIPDAELSDFPGALDLSTLTVLPGLIDTHTHLCDNTFLGDEWDPWTYPVATFGIIGTKNAKTTLEAGFTTVRNVTEPFYSDVALRDAIASGWVAGPRMYVSGAMISASGGHGNWGNWIAPQHKVDTDAHMIADGPDEVRKATRVHLKYGVDLIKIAATGGFTSHGTIPGAASYTVEEMRAAVDEARKRGLTVAAHAHGAEGITNAINAGVRSIEHATFLDERVIELLVERQVFVVMDLLAAHYDLIESGRDYADKQLSGDNNEEYAKYVGRFRDAHDAGVRMAFGTDAGVYPHGRNAEQFRLMVDAGMTPIEAIRSATLVAAELIGIKSNAGSIAPGKWADLVGVEGNPLEDVSLLERIDFVMKGGTIHKTHR